MDGKLAAAEDVSCWWYDQQWPLLPDFVILRGNQDSVQNKLVSFDNFATIDSYQRLNDFRVCVGVKSKCKAITKNYHWSAPV